MKLTDLIHNALSRRDLPAGTVPAYRDPSSPFNLHWEHPDSWWQRPEYARHLAYIRAYNSPEAARERAMAVVASHPLMQNRSDCQW